MVVIHSSRFAVNPTQRESMDYHRRVVEVEYETGRRKDWALREREASLPFEQLAAEFKGEMSSGSSSFELSEFDSSDLSVCSSSEAVAEVSSDVLLNGEEPAEVIVADEREEVDDGQPNVFDKEVPSRAVMGKGIAVFMRPHLDPVLLSKAEDHVAINTTDTTIVTFYFTPDTPLEDLIGRVTEVILELDAAKERMIITDSSEEEDDIFFAVPGMPFLSGHGMSSWNALGESPVPPLFGNRQLEPILEENSDDLRSNSGQWSSWREWSSANCMRTATYNGVKDIGSLDSASSGNGTSDESQLEGTGSTDSSYTSEDLSEREIEVPRKRPRTAQEPQTIPLMLLPKTMDPPSFEIDSQFVDYVVSLETDYYSVQDPSSGSMCINPLFDNSPPSASISPQRSGSDPALHLCPREPTKMKPHDSLPQPLGRHRSFESLFASSGGDQKPIRRGSREVLSDDSGYGEQQRGTGVWCGARPPVFVTTNFDEIETDVPKDSAVSSAATEGDPSVQNMAVRGGTPRRRAPISPELAQAFLQEESTAEKVKNLGVDHSPCVVALPEEDFPRDFFFPNPSFYHPLRSAISAPSLNETSGQKEHLQFPVPRVDPSAVSSASTANLHWDEGCALAQRLECVDIRREWVEEEPRYVNLEPPRLSSLSSSTPAPCPPPWPCAQAYTLKLETLVSSQLGEALESEEWNSTFSVAKMASSVSSNIRPVVGGVEGAPPGVNTQAMSVSSRPRHLPVNRDTLESDYESALRTCDQTIRTLEEDQMAKQQQFHRVYGGVEVYLTKKPPSPDVESIGANTSGGRITPSSGARVTFSPVVAEVKWRESYISSSDPPSPQMDLTLPKESFDPSHDVPPFLGTSTPNPPMRPVRRKERFSSGGSSTVSTSGSSSPRGGQTGDTVPHAAQEDDDDEDTIDAPPESPYATPPPSRATTLPPSFGRTQLEQEQQQMNFWKRFGLGRVSFGKKPNNNNNNNKMPAPERKPHPPPKPKHLAPSSSPTSQLNTSFSSPSTSPIPTARTSISPPSAPPSTTSPVAPATRDALVIPADLNSSRSTPTSSASPRLSHVTENVAMKPKDSEEVLDVKPKSWVPTPSRPPLPPQRHALAPVERAKLLSARRQFFAEYDKARKIVASPLPIPEEARKSSERLAEAFERFKKTTLDTRQRLAKSTPDLNAIIEATSVVRRREEGLGEGRQWRGGETAAIDAGVQKEEESSKRRRRSEEIDEQWEQLREKVRASACFSSTSNLSKRRLPLLESDLDASGDELFRNLFPETDVDQVRVPPSGTLSTYSMMNLSPSSRAMGRPSKELETSTTTTSVGGTVGDASRAKSMEYLLREENKAAVEPPENELMKGGERTPSEHELRIRRSLQKLNIPDWYKNRQRKLSEDGFLLSRKRGDSIGTSGGNWSKTTSLSSLQSSRSVTPTRVIIPTRTYSSSGWRYDGGSNSSITPSATSTGSTLYNKYCSSRSATTSPMTRRPYTGWRSQEKISDTSYTTPAERLARDLKADEDFRRRNSERLARRDSGGSATKIGTGSTSSLGGSSDQGDGTSQLREEVRNSIKEVTNAIVHYCSNEPASENKKSSDQSFTTFRPPPTTSKPPHPLLNGASTPRKSPLVWVESSFVGSRPIQSPETPTDPILSWDEPPNFRPSPLPNGSQRTLNGSLPDQDLVLPNTPLDGLTREPNLDSGGGTYSDPPFSLQSPPQQRHQGFCEDDHLALGQGMEWRVGDDGLLHSKISQMPATLPSSPKIFPEFEHPAHDSPPAEPMGRHFPVQRRPSTSWDDVLSSLLALPHGPPSTTANDADDQPTPSAEETDSPMKDMPPSPSPKVSPHAEEPYNSSNSAMTTPTAQENNNFPSTNPLHNLSSESPDPTFFEDLEIRIIEGDPCSTSASNSQLDSLTTLTPPITRKGSNLVIQCRNTKCENSTSFEDAQRDFKACHNCHTYYCSRECRRAHREKHRKVCLQLKVSALCNELTSQLRERSDAHLLLSKAARQGFLSRGRGCVKVFFQNSDELEAVVSEKVTRTDNTISALPVIAVSSLLRPAYTAVKELLPEEIGSENFKNLMELCQNYNADKYFILYLAVCIARTGEDRMTLATKYVKMKLSPLLSPQVQGKSSKCEPPNATASPLQSTSVNPLQLRHEAIITRDVEEQETMIFVSTAAENSKDEETRLRCLNTIRDHLLVRGVEIKTEFPNVYRRLQAYVEKNESFGHVIFYPKDCRTGRVIMCIIMLDVDPRRYQRLPTEISNVTVIDIH
ncbi:unnamed protein product [Cyprideis torosa]|uniref:Apical junction molecule ajm1 alpha/beta domain-containing protein n=1 Tax=Cyprideis torosa TaxID=163714 RepID=A0A7R8ZMK5_9CRUS|nr:unnamed protein product [Cyprideis torosa]CAG0889045.1 unnamed protein product [Cyprideis torosa]